MPSWARAPCCTSAAARFACDPAGTRAIAEQWTSAFPDWHFELLRLVAEGALVVAHMPYSGTHRGMIVGVEATGRSCPVDEMVIFRIADSRIAEAWEVYDDAGSGAHSEWPRPPDPLPVARNDAWPRNRARRMP